VKYGNQPRIDTHPANAAPFREHEAATTATAKPQRNLTLQFFGEPPIG
jgi:hypothetical protein